MSEAEEIVIDKLSLKVGKKDMAASLSALRNSDWSFQCDRKWIFVRQISISGHSNELRMRAGQALNVAATSAVDGRLANADHVNAVSFDSFPQLLAFLLMDVVAGQFAYRWYWRRWQYLLRESKANAVARILWENCEYLGAIIDQLMKKDLLDRIWSQLTHQSAGEILTKVNSVYVVSNAYRLTGRVKAEKTPLLVKNAILTSLSANKSNLAVWRKIVSPLADSDHRLSLAVRIIALQVMPKIWREWSGEVESMIIRQFFQHVIESMPTQTDPSTNLNKVALIEKQNSLDLRSAVSPVDDNSWESESSNIERKNNEDKVEIIADDFKEKRTTIDNKQPVKNNARLVSDLLYEAKSVGNIQPIESTNSKVAKKLVKKTIDPQHLVDRVPECLNEFECFTQFGGLFYLINLLRRKECQLILDEDVETSSGWLWLYDMSRQLDVTIDHSMTQFFASQLNNIDVERLVGWPTMPVVEAILKSLRAQKETCDLLNLEILQVPAFIAATSSHVDCYFYLTSVRLDVRLAGLDVNPGWVSWLGRVVNFHYVDKIRFEGS